MANILDWWGFNDSAQTMDHNWSGGQTISGGGGRLATNGLVGAASGSFFPVPGSPSSVVIAAYMRPSTANNVADLITFREGTTIHCRVTMRADGRFDLKDASGTVRDTSTYAWTLGISLDNVECKAVIHDSAGSMELRAYGVTIASFSGFDTKNGGSGVIDSVGLYRAPSDMVFDDVILADDWVGDLHVRTPVPTAAGVSTQWTPSTGANWSCVDETNASTTDYVGAGAGGLTDLYTMGDIPTADLPIAVRVSAYAAKSDAGIAPTVKLVTRGASGGEVEESAMLLATTYSKQVGAIRTTDPDGNPLTAARVNSMQAGMRSS